jgi:hypothetical protein
LVLSFATKIVIACSTAIDPNNPSFDPIAENVFYTKIYFYSLLLTILGIIVLYFLRGRKGLWLFFAELKGLWLIIITSLAVLFSIGFLFISIFIQDCGYTLRNTLGKGLLILLTLFFLQFVSWIGQIKRSKPKLR